MFLRSDVTSAALHILTVEGHSSCTSFGQTFDYGMNTGFLEQTKPLGCSRAVHEDSSTSWYGLSSCRLQKCGLQPCTPSSWTMCDVCPMCPYYCQCSLIPMITIPSAAPQGERDNALQRAQGPDAALSSTPGWAMPWLHKIHSLL